MAQAMVEADVKTRSWYPDFGRWLAVFCVLGIAGLVVLEGTHAAWLDICDQSHEPPTTALGTATATLATLVPWLFALRTGARPVQVIATLAAVMEALVWWWLFSPVGNC